MRGVYTSISTFTLYFYNFCNFFITFIFDLEFVRASATQAELVGAPLLQRCVPAGASSVAAPFTSGVKGCSLVATQLINCSADGFES